MPRLTLQPGGARQVDVRPDADGEHHQIGGDGAAIGELHALGALGAEDLFGLAVGEEGDAAPVEIALQELSGGGVELALHQRRHQMHQRDRHAALLEAPGGFEPEQAAADHHGAFAGARGREHLVDIGDVAEGADARQAEARDRRRQRPRAGRDQQPVVGDAEAARGGDGLRLAVDVRDRVAGDQANAVRVVPLAGIDDDLVEALVAGEHARQHDAVVVDMRLGAEHGDAVAPPGGRA